MDSKLRKKRKEIIGVVTGRSGDKTIKVTYAYKIPHSRYLKEIKRETIIHTHDEKNECKAGDVVTVVETRPYSKTKTWKLKSLDQRAGEV